MMRWEPRPGRTPARSDFPLFLKNSVIVLRCDTKISRSPECRVDQPDNDGGYSPEFQKILSQFKPIVAEMLILRYVEDYSDERIATALVRPRVWVAVTLSRARKKLEKAMRASGETR